jgi:ABC-type transport system substrate-binding protein
MLDQLTSLLHQIYDVKAIIQWGGYTALAQKQFDPLIQIVASSYDEAKRREASYKLQKLDYDYALSIHHFQAVENVAFRDWLKGYLPGAQPTNLDFYLLSKE